METMTKNSKRKSSIPNPALKIFEKLIGKWELKGHTLDSKEDNITGWNTFERCPEDFFLNRKAKSILKAVSCEAWKSSAMTQRQKHFLQTSMQACPGMSFHTNGIFGATHSYIRDQAQHIRERSARTATLSRVDGDRMKVRRLRMARLTMLLWSG